MASNSSHPSSSQAPTPVSKATLDKVMKLPGFKFTGKHLFHASHRDAIYHALGAITAHGRAGQQATVLRHITIVFRNVIHTHRLYPSLGFESPGFWGAVFSDVRKEAPGMAKNLSIAVLVDVVSVYTQGYADGREDRMEEKSDDDRTSEEDNLDVTKPFNASTDPKKILMPLIRCWAKAFRKYKSEQRKNVDTDPGNAAANAAPTPTSELTQPPNEPDVDYIARLQSALIAANKENASLKRKQVWSDEHNQKMTDGLHATIDRMEVKMKETQSELRLVKRGVGADEGDPWVPLNQHAARVNQIIAEDEKTDDEEEDGDYEEDADEDDGDESEKEHDKDGRKAGRNQDKDDENDEDY